MIATTSLHASTASGIRTGSVATAVLPALFAALLGAFLIFGTGFLEVGVLHSAAHDSRHALAFPCH